MFAGGAAAGGEFCAARSAAVRGAPVEESDDDVGAGNARRSGPPTNGDIMGGDAERARFRERSGFDETVECPTRLRETGDARAGGSR